MSTSASTAMTLANAIAASVMNQAKDRPVEVQDAAAIMQACALVGIAEGVRRIAVEMERRSS